MMYGRAILWNLRGILRWASYANNRHMGRLTLRPVRIGGATCFFIQGASAEDIQKYGSRRAHAVNVYLYLGDVAYRILRDRFKP